jgi:hypothetical protein
MIILTSTSPAIVLPWPVTSRGDQAHPMPGPRFPRPTGGHATVAGAGFDTEIIVRGLRDR